MNHDSEASTIVGDCHTCTANEPAAMSRRSLLSALIGAAATCMGAILAVPIVRYLLYPIETKAQTGEWSNLGDASEFARNQGPVTRTITLIQRDGWREVASAKSVYVSHAGNGQLIVLSAVCPHLGCSVSWHADRNRFICPCHGGEFKPDGQRASGPPPRNMDELRTQLKDGKLQVRYQNFRSNAPSQETLS